MRRNQPSKKDENFAPPTPTPRKMLKQNQCLREKLQWKEETLLYTKDKCLWNKSKVRNTNELY